VQSRAAFSLTEVVIAMGVAAVAFTSIIALFPLGLNMSKESYEATQAAVIAQTILADLSDSGSAKAGGKLIQIKGTNTLNSINYTTIPMTWAKGATADRYIYLAYDQQIRTDSSNSPIMLRPTASFVSLNGPADPNWFTNGTNGPVLLVKVSIKHAFLLGGPASTTVSANPQRVDVTVESPASAPATNRTQYVFTGIIHQT
jgi:type II secretory pathway pseudopilin PulG